MQLRIGDRVLITSTFEGWTNCGEVGQVCSINFTSYPSIVGVYFKNWDRGHDCGGELQGEKSKSGWNYYSTQLTLTNKPLTNFTKK